jgi:DNA mismatch repair ATPase MutS
MYNANINMKNNYNNVIIPTNTTLNINECSNDINNNNNESILLETELASKLREIQLIENELRKIPDKPRTLNEIKLKKEKNEKLSQLEDTVSKLRQKLRQLNK